MAQDHGTKRPPGRSALFSMRSLRAFGKGVSVLLPSDASRIADAQKAFAAYVKRAKSSAVGRCGIVRGWRHGYCNAVCARSTSGLDYSLGQIEALALGEVARRREISFNKPPASLDATNRRTKSFARRRTKMESGRRSSGPSYRRETDSVAAAFRPARAVTFPRGESLESAARSRVHAAPVSDRRLFAARRIRETPARDFLG